MGNERPSVIWPHTLLLCAGVVLLLAACGSGDDLIPPGPPGTLVVSAATTGPDADANGYRVSLDSGPAQTLGTNGSTTFEAVPSGEHTLLVSGVSGNCDVTGGATQTVAVVPEDSTTIELQVTCSLQPPLFSRHSSTSTQV